MDDDEALRKYFMYTDMKREGRTMSIEDEVDMEVCERHVLLHQLLDKEAFPVIHLLRSNGDLLPEVEGDTITFELEYKGHNCLGKAPTTMGTNTKDSVIYNALVNARITASLKFARRTDITESQAQPVLDEFITEVRAWFAETFKLEPC